MRPSNSLFLLSALASSTLAANNVPQKVTYSATGAADVGGNGFGCAHIKSNGQNMLGCVKRVFADGFTVGTTNEATKAVTLCSIKGATGTCGVANPLTVNVDLATGSGAVPPPSGAAGTTTLAKADLTNPPPVKVAKRANNVPQKVTFSATGAADVGGNGFGCAHIKSGGVTMLGCVKRVFADGFTVGATNEATKAVTLCSIKGATGTCGVANPITATVDLATGSGAVPPPSGAAGTKTLAAVDLTNPRPVRLAKRANNVPQKVTFTAGAATAGGNGFGCADIKSGGVTMLACVKRVFADGFTVGVTNLATKAATLCSIQGATGTCGVANPVTATVDLATGSGAVPPPSGAAGTTTLSKAELTNPPPAKVAKRANNVPQKVTYSATGAANVVGNHFGCAHIKSNGQNMLGCVKRVFADGFTVGTTNEATKAVTLCSIKGATGTCGVANPLTVTVDLATGSGAVPPPSGAAGTKTLAKADLTNPRPPRFVMVRRQAKEADADEE